MRRPTICAGSRTTSQLRHPGSDDFYIVVEKILGAGESLPADWPVCGTTGYEFAAMVNGLFVDPRNERAFDTIYSRFVVRAARAAVIRRSGVSEQEAGAARNDVGRHQLARSPVESVLGAQPALPRLHAVQPDLDDQRSDRLLPGVSHLHHGDERSRTTIAATSSKRSAARSGAYPESRASCSISSSACC
jgi:hypothetical protein